MPEAERKNTGRCSYSGGLIGHACAAGYYGVIVKLGSQKEGDFCCMQREIKEQITQFHRGKFVNIYLT